MSSSQPNSVQPGWYPDHYGQMRWWDGVQWTNHVGAAAFQAPQAHYGVAPIQKPIDAKMWAAVAHATYFLFGIIGSLVIMLTVGAKDRFVKHNAVEALNYQITHAIINFVLMMAWMAWFFIWVAQNSNPREFQGDPPAFMFIVLGIIVLISLAFMVFAIVGVVKASQGKWWRYPMSVRFVRGAVSQEEIETLPQVP